MCVILALETTKELESLSLDILKSAEAMNPDGNGYATLKNGKVTFEKGVSMESIWHKIETKEIVAPCIIHARITSVGVTTPELCHPFVVNEDSSNPMSGTIKDSETVLFHNGTFSEYKDLVLQTAMGSGRHLPSGKMSDTRGLAFVLQTLGIEALEYIDTGFNKFAVLNSKGLQKFGSWVDVDGISSSNNYYASMNRYGNFPQNNYFQSDEIDWLNDEDTLYYNSENRKIENDSIQYDYTKAKAETEKKVSKKEHKANVKFLKSHGWKSVNGYTKAEIQKIVDNMQQQKALVDKIEEKKKEHFVKYGIDFEDTYSIEDYEDVRNYQRYNS